MPIVPADQLRQVSIAAFQKAGVSNDAASLITNLLIKANLAGHDSHGVIRIPDYIGGVRKDHIRPHAEIQILQETPTSAKIDGGAGFGQVVLTDGVEIALQKSNRAPISLVTVTNYSHCGQLGSYAQMISAKDRIGILLLGKQKGAVVPWGAITGRLYQNTLAVSVPSNKPFPVVLDMATSVAPFGKILMKRARNEPCPAGWLINAAGTPTNNPHLDLSAGEAGLLPLGGLAAGNKGSGLTFMLGILATMLPGAGAGGEGTLIIAINPEYFMSIDAFKIEVNQFIDYLHETPPATEFEGVLVPGERSHRETQRQLQEGLFVEEKTWKEIQALASE